MEWNLSMKKIIYSLGLSVLLSYPTWAQEQQPQPLQNDTPALSEEDAQTIFFSEDFLNELTQDDDVQIFKEIPLDKTSSPNLQKNLDTNEGLSQKIEKAPSKTQAPTLPVQTSTKTVEPSPAALPQPMVQDKNKQLKQPQISVQKKPENLRPNISNRPLSSEKKPVNLDVKNIQLKQPMPQNLPQNVEEKKFAPQTPSVIKSQEVSTTQKEVPAQNIQKAIRETPRSVDENKPSLQEMIQEQKPAYREDVSIAPSRPKTNAYSLDKMAPLPQSMLQEDGLSTNMLNRGIRISPEQRARMMMKKKFSEMDLNQDGIITKAEFIRFKTAEAQRIATQVYQQIDTNGDNILSETEYDVLMNKMIENYIKAPQQK